MLEEEPYHYACPRGVHIRELACAVTSASGKVGACLRKVSYDHGGTEAAVA